MIIKGLYLYKIRVFDITNFLNQLKELNIKAYKIKKEFEYTYTFYAPLSSKKTLLMKYNNIEIVKSVGLLASLYNLLKYKTTIIALIISCLFYYNLTTYIWSINIYSNAPSLNNFINEQLNNNNIYIGAKALSIDELSTISKKILYNNYDTIEYLSIEKNGCEINVSFKKKRKENDKTHLKKSLYASRDGLIKSFDLLSGEKAVNINDYVKKGDLLVKDVVTSDYNKDIYIGTYGSVYAYTWYYCEIMQQILINESDAEILANSLLVVKSNICKNFTANEYIYSENVLQLKKESNMMYIKVHFTCVENIAKE